MGAYAPAPVCPPAVHRECLAMMQKVVDRMRAEGKPYQGCLYGGFMLTATGPSILEFNCRFGDPETQVVLPLLKSDLFEVMLACAEGRLAQAAVEWHPGAAATVVCAARVAGGPPAGGTAPGASMGWVAWLGKISLSASYITMYVLLVNNV
ncbi:unnamed protein product [Heterosigma akashiwo]